MLETIIKTSENLEYGILIAVVLVAIELVVIAVVNSNKSLNPLSYIIGIGLCALLAFQMSRLIGALTINSVCNDIQNVVGVFSPTAAKMIDDLAGVSSSDIIWFVVRRCLWSLLFMALAAVAIAMTMNRKLKRSSGVPRGAQVGRRTSHAEPRRRR